MHPSDAAYLALVGSIRATARALRWGLPVAWRMRLEATAPDHLRPGWVWLHAVSVGELLLAEGLVRKLRSAGHRIHLTTGTPAGLSLLTQRLPVWDEGSGSISGGAFPLDDSAGLKSFFLRPPAAFIALETELWPNLIRELERRGIPRIIVNGRLTERSEKRGGPWLRRAASRLSLVAARDESSATAFRKLGAPTVFLGGNLKADMPTPEPLPKHWESLRQAWKDDPFLIAGSTLEGEEALILEVWRRLRVAHPTLKLILAPRQPRRFLGVAEILEKQNLAFHRASGIWPDESAWSAMDVLCLDTLGELPAAYGEGTVALVGGGWRGQGGHNPLEPVRWGIPTVIGPGYRNFEDLVEPLRKAGLVQVVEEGDLAGVIETVLQTAPLRGSNPNAGTDLPNSLAGALDKTWVLVQPFLSVPV